MKAVLSTILALAPCVASSQTQLPMPAAPFKGEIGKTYKDSKQDYPQPVKPPSGAPNVLLILLDAVGYGQPSTFGGPIATPNLDKLAERGLRYTRMHTTAICSPTRAALLTGRNHHQVGFGTITELSTGFPGYDGIWGKNNASIAEVLHQYGYATAWFGKNHNTPDWETGPGGPFDRWPTGLGFEYFYGFHGGETSQWEPQMIRNTLAVETLKTPEEGYHLDVDLADEAIAYIRRQQSAAPDKPFFVYYATGCAHAPHHTPKEWADKYKGKFDMGWDRMREETLARQKKLGVVPADTKLTARPKEIPAWDEQTPEAKKVYARQMEVFAGFLSHCDHHIGRLLDYVQSLPNANNTLIMFIAGDNGPSPEGTMTGTLNNMMTQNGFPDSIAAITAKLNEMGGPKHENHYGVPWAWAGAAPFQWMKRVPSHFGGTRNGMVVVWPKRIKDAGGIRTQFTHVIDVVPTLEEVIGITAPTEVNGVKQTEMAGTSFAYTFDDAKAAERHRVQYFETGGHRAIYKDGWVAAARHGVPWILTGSVDFATDKWELYNIDQDFSEADDLAAQNPEKLKELQAVFDEEAAKYNVFPLDDRFAERGDNPQRPSVTRGVKKFTYFPGTVRVPEGSAAPTKMRTHSITAELVIPKGGAEGVIIASGGIGGGYSLFIKGGKLTYDYSFFGAEHYILTSSKSVPTGNVTVTYEFEQGPGKERGAGGTGKLLINGESVGEVNIKRQVPARFSATETQDIGMDLGGPVSERYGKKRYFPFTGEIKQVVVELK